MVGCSMLGLIQFLFPLEASFLFNLRSGGLHRISHLLHVAQAGFSHAVAVDGAVSRLLVRRVVQHLPHGARI